MFLCLKRYVAVIAVLLFLIPSICLALPEYSEKTSQGCFACHKDSIGGDLNQTGLEYSASGHMWPPTGGFKVISPLGKASKAVTGFIHFIAGFMWFGTILYVHIVLRPAYASKGLPRMEVLLGISCMFITGATGALLTFSRINSLDVLTGTSWGRILLIKISLYCLMVSSAAFVVFYVGPRLRKSAGVPPMPVDGVYNTTSLSVCDGKDGRPALIAFEGKVYDTAGSHLWKDGAHYKHMAGEDLTKAIQKAPHGAEKLEKLVQSGAFDPSSKPPLSSAQKLFYFFAYMNLALVFIVLLVIAWWRWGI